MHDDRDILYMITSHEDVLNDKVFNDYIKLKMHLVMHALEVCTRKCSKLNGIYIQLISISY